MASCSWLSVSVRFISDLRHKNVIGNLMGKTPLARTSKYRKDTCPTKYTQPSLHAISSSNPLTPSFA